MSDESTMFGYFKYSWLSFKTSVFIYTLYTGKKNFHRQSLKIALLMGK